MVFLQSVAGVWYGRSGSLPEERKMAKAFSVLSWNVEHFGAKGTTRKPAKPIPPIVDYLATHNADVIAVYEVVGAHIFSEVVTKMPNYHWHITEGPQAQEILVGVKRNLTAFFTQKLEFKSGVSVLRPGGLLTVTVDGEHYPLLFLHLKSLTDPRGFGLRDDMLEKAIKFRKTLNKASGTGKANYIFMGDLNTMGMNLTYNDKDISGDEEIERLQKRLNIKSVQMNILDKNHQTTWWPGSNSKYDPANLDHVVAANHMEFKKFGGLPVDVRGWVEETTDSARDNWAKKYSDHALLYFEVQKVSRPPHRNSTTGSG